MSTQYRPVIHLILSLILVFNSLLPTQLAFSSKAMASPHSAGQTTQASEELGTLPDHLLGYELELAENGGPALGGKKSIASHISVAYFNDYVEHQTGRTISSLKRSELNRLIKWAGDKYRESYHEGVQLQVLVIPPEYQNISEKKAFLKLSKELGWDLKNSSQLKIEDESQPWPEHLHELADSIQTNAALGSTLLFGKPLRSSASEKIIGSLIRFSIAGSVVGGTIIVSAPDAMTVVEQMQMAGLPAMVAGSLSGLLQYFKDQVDTYMRYSGILHLNKEKRQNFIGFLAKQYMLSFSWLSVVRSSMWMSGVIEQNGLWPGLVDTLSVAATTGALSMLAAIPMNKAFADQAPELWDKSPRAERIRRKSRSMALTVAAILTLGGSLLQHEGTAAIGSAVLMGITASGLVMLGQVHQEAIATRSQRALAKIRQVIRRAPATQHSPPSTCDSVLSSTKAS